MVLMEGEVRSVGYPGHVKRKRSVPSLPILIFVPSYAKTMEYIGLVQCLLLRVVVLGKYQDGSRVSMVDYSCD